jgi:phosphoribosylanthranilate isomerase
MSRTKLKVCGITTLEDAMLAIRYGADYIGFNFYRKSPRYITPEVARDIVRDVGDSVVPVGVLVNESLDAAEALIEESGVRLVQLHGDEDETYCEAIGKARVIKVIRPGANFDIATIGHFPAHAFLVDASDEKLYGGTGRTANWEVAAELARVRPTLLAGGIGPDNVREAISRVAPYAVDVNSAVESSPGIKDGVKLAQLRLEMSR